MRKNRKPVVLQTTAMLDVIFILLIFFVAVSKVRDGQLDIRLADVREQEHRSGSNSEEAIVISVNRDDQIELNGIRVKDDIDLREKLSREDPAARIVFAPDREARSGSLIATLKAVTDSGFQNVSFLYDPKRSSE
jgi:biopolymer transport protein ExbD